MSTSQPYTLLLPHLSAATVQALHADLVTHGPPAYRSCTYDADRGQLDLCTEGALPPADLVLLEQRVLAFVSSV